MPVSVISGLAGTVGSNPDPGGLQAFADHLERAQEAQRQQAIQQLNFMMNLTKESGGMWTPDPQVLEKTAKQAGLPKGFFKGTQGPSDQGTPAPAGPTGVQGLPETITSPGNIPGLPGATTTVQPAVRPLPGTAPQTPVPGAPTAGAPAAPGGGGVFGALAGRYQQQAQQQALIDQAAAEKAQTEIMTQHLKQRAADVNASPAERAQANFGRLMIGDMTMEDFLKTKALDSMSPNEIDHMADVTKKKILGEHTETEYNDMARAMIPSLLADYDGDVGKAAQAAGLIVRGQALPKDLAPPMTDANLKRAATIITTLGPQGWPNWAIQQAILAKTMDPGELASKFNWNQKQLDEWARSKSYAERQVAADEGRLEEEKKRTGIEQQKADAEVLARIETILKTTQSAPIEKAMKTMELLREAELAKHTPPQAAWDAAGEQLMQALVGTGLPLEKRDVRNWMTFWRTTPQWTYTPPAPKVSEQNLPGTTPQPSIGYQVGAAIRQAPELPLGFLEGLGGAEYGAIQASIDAARGIAGQPPGGPPIDPLVEAAQKRAREKREEQSRR